MATPRKGSSTKHDHFTPSLPPMPEEGGHLRPNRSAASKGTGGSTSTLTSLLTMDKEGSSSLSMNLLRSPTV